MVSEADVTMAYRLLMGREPEDPRVVSAHAAACGSLAELRAEFMSSAEFRGLMGDPGLFKGSSGVKPLTFPPIAVEIDVPADILRRMVERIEGEFLYLGQHEPHWSVLTSDRYKADQIDQNEAEFFASGEQSVNEFLLAASRTGLDLSGFRSCFELGCGVGRLTLWLARHFDQVIGGDISESHLEHARAAASRAGQGNISFRLLNQIARYKDLPRFDVFFSLIVLQHNPPPLMAHLLDVILTQLAPGGIAYFQIPTYKEDYSFAAQAYLDTPAQPGDIEVHCLPQDRLFSIFARTGCEVLEFREDGSVGTNAISNRVLLRKKAKPAR